MKTLDLIYHINLHPDIFNEHFSLLTHLSCFWHISANSGALIRYISKQPMQVYLFLTSTNYINWFLETAVCNKSSQTFTSVWSNGVITDRIDSTSIWRLALINICTYINHRQTPLIRTQRGSWNMKGIFSLGTNQTLLYKHQWNTRWAFAQKFDIFTCKNNMLSKNCLSEVVLYFTGVYIINRTLHGRL